MNAFHPRANWLTPEEVEAIATPILMERLARYGLEEVTVTEGEDHYGDPIFKIVARYGKAPTVPSGRDLIESGSAVQTALLDRGEPRFAMIYDRFPARKT